MNHRGTGGISGRLCIISLQQWAQTPTLRTACREILQGPSGEKPELIPRTRKAAESEQPTANQRPINIRSPTDQRHIITPWFTEHRNGTSRSCIHPVKDGEKRHQPTCSVRSSTCLSVHLSVCGRSSTCLSAGGAPLVCLPDERMLLQQGGGGLLYIPGCGASAVNSNLLINKRTEKHEQQTSLDTPGSVVCNELRLLQEDWRAARGLNVTLIHLAPIYNKRGEICEQQMAHFTFFMRLFICTNALYSVKVHDLMQRSFLWLFTTEHVHTLYLKEVRNSNNIPDLSLVVLKSRKWPYLNEREERVRLAISHECISHVC